MDYQDHESDHEDDSEDDHEDDIEIDDEDEDDDSEEDSDIDSDEETDSSDSDEPVELQNRVDVLFAGYSHTKGNTQYANCTCTLIRTKCGRNIIVDTMTAWDGKRIREALQVKFSLKPKNINYVVCTHAHSDHTGCNNLFLDAKFHITGTSRSTRDAYHEITGTLNLTENCEVFIRRTPGHTNSCVSVFVIDSPLTEGMVGICGDLFECADDIESPEKWQDAGSEDPKEQRRQRQLMAEQCSYIIPGHGLGFEVTPRMREKLSEDLKANK